MGLKIDVTNGTSLVEQMTTIFYIIENFNNQLIVRLINKDKSFASSLLKRCRDNSIENEKLPFLLQELHKNDIEPIQCKKCGKIVDNWLTDRSDNVMVRSTKLKSSVKQISAYDLSYKFTYFSFKSGDGWVSSRFKIIYENEVLAETAKMNFSFIDQPINSFDVLLDTLIQKNKMGEQAAKHYIQVWIRKQFKLEYNSDMKVALKKVVNIFNKYFYSKSRVGNAVFKTTRPATIEPRVLIGSIRRILEIIMTPEEAKKSSIGIFLMLKLCKAYRVRYVFSKKEENKNNYNKKIIVNTNSPSLVDDLSTSLENGFYCLDALRPLEFNYLQVICFGSFSCVKGLSKIFRGGLLPHTRQGKISTVTGKAGSGKTTLALQRLIEIAFYGGFSVYFSFEEEADLIVERLNSFSLTNAEHFKVIETSTYGYLSDIAEYRNKNPGKGLLVLFNFSDSDETIVITKLISRLSNVAIKLGWKYLAVSIDSINSMIFKPKWYQLVVNEKLYKRKQLHALIKCIKKSKYTGIIISEQGDRDFDMIPYLSDTALEISTKEHSRFLEIKKARNQNFQLGKHPFRISDGVGMIVYPNLNAVLSSLRNRISTTISEEKICNFSPEVSKQLGFDGLLDKSLTLVYGKSKNGKTNFIYDILTSASSQIKRSSTDRNIIKPPQSVCVFTFRTSEVRYEQLLRGYNFFYSRWQQISNKQIRHFTPGRDFTSEQIIDIIWSHIKSAQRKGFPIERILIDEVESAELAIPDLRNKPLFWPTLIELLTTEAITSVFSIEQDKIDDTKTVLLKDSMDYIFKIDQKIIIEQPVMRNADLDEGNNTQYQIGSLEKTTRKENYFTMTVDKWVEDKKRKKRGPLQRKVSLVFPNK